MSETGDCQRSELASLSQSEDTPAFKRDENLWFDDGNVILVAQGVGFRVYRGILGRYSEVFRDMFTLAQPSATDEREGCPVVELSDTASEVRHLLEALFTVGTGNRFRRDLSAPIGIVLAMFRMGSKYNVPMLRKEALRRLELALVSADSVFETGAPPQPPPLDVKNSTGWAISVVNLARSFDIPSILPGAFYLCSQLPLDALIAGIHISGDSYEKLSEEDLGICLQGRDKLIARNVIVAANMVVLASQGFGCSGPGSCAARVQDLFSAAKFTHPRAISPSVITSLGLCRSCSPIVTRNISNQLSQTWRFLGGFFQVSPWPIVRPTPTFGVLQ